MDHTESAGFSASCHQCQGAAVAVDLPDPRTGPASNGASRCRVRVWRGADSVRAGAQWPVYEDVAARAQGSTSCSRKVAQRPIVRTNFVHGAGGRLCTMLFSGGFCATRGPFAPRIRRDGRRIRSRVGNYRTSSSVCELINSGVIHLAVDGAGFAARRVRRGGGRDCGSRWRSSPLQ